MDYDKTDISKTYNHGRDLAPDVLKQWMDVVVGHVDEETIRCIVDLGCGTGRFSPSLSERFAASVIGVDPSSKMLAEARIDRSRRRPLCMRLRRSDSISAEFCRFDFHIDGISPFHTATTGGAGMRESTEGARTFVFENRMQ
jgi:SAM-dependent methyltransferase